jgi:cytochrome c-type biogenesis protein CcsB
MTFETYQARQLTLLFWEIRLFWSVVFLYGLSFFLYISFLLQPRRWGGWIGSFAGLVLWIGAGAHTLLILLRTYEGGIAPFQTLYESLSWFAWSAIVVFLWLQLKTKVKLPALFIIPVALGACLYALLSPKIDPSIQPLAPPLQSWWFEAHVIVAFASYAVFIVSFGVEATYLCFRRSALRGQKRAFNLGPFNIKSFHNWAHKLILWGFPLLTFGVVSGAMWADQAWGRYWGWDPKETWSLITWLIYAFYLHARVTPRWMEDRASFINIVGFICMLMTFLGVNWLAKLFGIPGLHLYAV